MIKFENVSVVGWEHAIRGMRNPMNSWEKSDSSYCQGRSGLCDNCAYKPHDDYSPCYLVPESKGNVFVVGNNDLGLMKQLRWAGTDHRKYLRMIAVYVDITAPLYWWKEFDTYKVGTVANSCSTMHKIMDKEFTLDDFSHEHLVDETTEEVRTDEFMQKHTIVNNNGNWSVCLEYVVWRLNYARNKYLEAKTKPMKSEQARKELMKKYWWQIIQLLPSSYNQKRTVMLNYEVLNNIYKSRKHHKLDEWSKHEGVIDGDKTNKAYIGFCDWIETLPYAKDLII